MFRIWKQARVPCLGCLFRQWLNPCLGCFSKGDSRGWCTGHNGSDPPPPGLELWQNMGTNLDLFFSFCWNIFLRILWFYMYITSYYKKMSKIHSLASMGFNSYSSVWCVVCEVTIFVTMKVRVFKKLWNHYKHTKKTLHIAVHMHHNICAPKQIKTSFNKQFDFIAECSNFILFHINRGVWGMFKIIIIIHSI